MRRPLLSLAVIVRDEAAALEGLLAGTREFCNEQVVVDTGSQDGSVAVARSAGAHVIQEAWRHDFAAARNRGLEAVRGRWVLVLDCDERVAATDLARLRHLARSADDRVYSLPQRNYTNRRELPDAQPVRPDEQKLAAGAEVFVEARQIRLFPARPDLRYSGSVHEGIDAAVAAGGLTVVQENVPVHHYGHLPVMEKDPRRKALYGSMLRDKIHQHPQDPLARYELAVQLANEGRLELSERLLARTVRDAPGAPGLHRARLLLGRLQAARGDHTAAVRQTSLAVDERPDQPACWVAAVRAHVDAGAAGDARMYLERGLSLFPHESHLIRQRNMLMNQEKRETADHKSADRWRLRTGTVLATVEAKETLDRPEHQAGQA